MTDKEYEKARNKLIPVAEKIANDQEGNLKPEKGGRSVGEWSDAWNRVFFREMNRLARETGLV